MEPAAWAEWILESVPRLPSEEVSIAEAVGRTLAAPAFPSHALPIWDNSAMDGYALRHVDTLAATVDEPVVFDIIGEVAAGSSEDPELPPGSAVRIMTGAAIPTAADAVVAVEGTSPRDLESLDHRDRDLESLDHRDRDLEGLDHRDRDLEGLDQLGLEGLDHQHSGTAGSTGSVAPQWANDRFAITAAVPEGAHVRRAGEDIPLGTELAGPGDHLTPARASALAAAGVARVTVAQQPRVAVIVTGSELTDPGTPLRRGQIPESNSVLVAGLVRDAGLAPAHVVRSSDDPDGFRDLLRRLSAECEVIITTGGVGPGRHDIVRIAMDREPGVRQTRVAIRPGQPQCAGQLDSGSWIFALPGNPVSAAVSFELFVRPALLAMQGRTDPHRTIVTAIAEESWQSRPGRLQVLPVSVRTEDERLHCRPSVNPRGVSHAVGSHGGTDGYALIAPERGDVALGDEVPVMLVPSW